MDWSNIQTEFEALVANEEIMDGGEVMTFDSVVSGTTDEVETKLSKARTYAQRLGTTVTSSPEGHIFINGKYHVADDVCCRHALVPQCDTKRNGSERLE
jgi:UDP-glucose:glycoprotein glucosyltransferase